MRRFTTSKVALALAGVGIVPAFMLVGVGVTIAAPAQSAMCADINVTYANASLEANQWLPNKSYSRSQYSLGDVITITVTAVSATGGAVNIGVSGAGYPGFEPDAITPSNISMQNVGSVSTTVTDTTGPNISISAVVGSAAPSGVPTTFSISCVSAPPPAPGPGAAPIDPIVNVIQKTHTSLVARTISVPSLPQRIGVAGAGPGSFSANPSGSGVVLNYATSLVQLQNWGAASSAADALANTDPLDQPFNFWIDGSGALHARTSAGDNYWGTFGLFSAGADYLVSKQVLLGLAVHADGMRDTSASSEITSHGLMVGPYLSAELTEGVYVDLAAYYGRSWSDVTNGAYSGDYDSQRLLMTGRIKGHVDLDDQLRLAPNVTLFYLREAADAYTLSDGVGGTMAGAGFDATQFRISVGGDLSYAIDLGDGQTLTPMIGVNLGLVHESGSQYLFGNATTGLTYAADSNASFSIHADASADETSFRSLGARASARLAF